VDRLGTGGFVSRISAFEPPQVLDMDFTRPAMTS